MLTFVGLGLWDERSITTAGRDAIASADQVFAEFYTSRLAGTTISDLEAFHDTTIDVRDRSGIEADPHPILAAAEAGDVAFLTAGETMIATTHVDLRLRAHDRDIETRVVHGTSAATAAAALTGLQNYRFGPPTTLPFPRDGSRVGSESGTVPASVLDTIADNRDRGLHTLVYLDIAVDRDDGKFMTGDVAARLLATEWPSTLGVVVARAGSEDPHVTADHLDTLAQTTFGDPLHLLVIPGDLHPMEAAALRTFAGAPPDVGPSS